MGARCAPERIGVIFVVHGGFDEFAPQHLFDTTVQIFSYDHNHFVYRNVIWNPSYWGFLLQMDEAQREIGKYSFSQERVREMRGESLGNAWLYESDKELPSGQWGYLYWDALTYLKNRGVKHIAVGFPQITIDSVLNLVEVPNQIAKEIGYKTWLHIDSLDFEAFPSIGHPFADYWGNWVSTDCGGVDCCFEMGGCADGRPYPPPRQTPIDEPRGDMDPSLAFDVSAYGHLGYDPALGPPDSNAPVQDQYSGTWALYSPPNGDPRVARLLAKHVGAVVCSM